MVKTLTLRRHARARVWIDEGATSGYAAREVVTRDVAAGPRAARWQRVTIERTFPMGGMIGYGLIGVVWSAHAEEGVPIEVPCSDVGGEAWPGALVSEEVRLGLPREFADAVAEGLADGARDRLRPGRVRVVEAAHGRVGSSEAVMGWLGLAVIEAMLLEEDTEAAMVAILERPLSDQRSV